MSSGLMKSWMNLFDKYEGRRGRGEGGKIERLSQRFRRLLNGNTEGGGGSFSHKIESAKPAQLS